MKELNHLADIFEKYDTFVIDLWGVIHNGVALNPNAIEAVDQLKKHSKKTKIRISRMVDTSGPPQKKMILDRSPGSWAHFGAPGGPRGPKNNPKFKKIQKNQKRSV